MLPRNDAALRTNSGKGIVHTKSGVRSWEPTILRRLGRQVWMGFLTGAAPLLPGSMVAAPRPPSPKRVPGRRLGPSLPLCPEPPSLRHGILS
jgi:hypothetical protein